ncbi:hypothetical protein ACFQXA_01990 [Nocardiopsis composta]
MLRRVARGAPLRWAAAAVLGAAAVGVPGWAQYRELADTGAIPPAAEAADGATARLAGSEWEFLGAEAGEEPYPGARSVDVFFAVTPEDGAAAERVGSYCRLRAVDGRGRVWEDGLRAAAGPPFLEEAGETAGGGCLTAPPDNEPFPPGEASLLAVHFTVAADAGRDLRFEVEVATHVPEEDPLEETSLTDLEEFEEEKDPPRPAAVSFGYREFDRAVLGRWGIRP